MIKDGVVYSDSLNPDFVAALDKAIKSGKLTYDFAGIDRLKKLLEEQFVEKETQEQINELCQWLRESI